MPNSNPRASDPVNGTLAAFNTSYAQFDLYTNKTVAKSYGLFGNNTRPNMGAPLGNLTWFSNVVNTQTGVPVNGTGFKFISNATGISQSINWTKINIPQGVGSNTYLRFDWNGTLLKGTSAQYQLYNASRIIPFLNQTRTGPPYPLTVPGGPPLNKTGGIPLRCGTNDECFDVSKYIGFNITLAFILNSNSTGKGIKFQVSNIEVVSVASPFQSISNFMLLNPSNSTEVIHNADLSLTYNATVTYHKPNTTNQNLNHTWVQMVSTFYLPSSYRLTSINLNDTSHPVSLTYPIGQGPCSVSGCTNSTFTALNMTINKTIKSTALVQAKSLNSETSLQTLLEGVPTDFWIPGESLQVQVNNQQGVYTSGSNNILVMDPVLNIEPGFNQTFTGVKRGLLINNFTNAPLPASHFGPWTITSTFKNGYDYGSLSHVFRLDQMQVNSFSTGGNNNALNVQGKLSYANNSLAASVNGVVFAVDSGIPNTNPITIPASNSPSNSLYLSNLTLINGVFTLGQPLVMIFAIVNPNASRLFSANVTIEHEWSSSQPHGANVTIPLTVGDEPFTASKSYAYEADVSLTPNGIQVKITSLSTLHSKTAMMSVGKTPVVATRQHTGVFKIKVTSAALGFPSTATSTSLESPPYAYVLAGSLVPGKYLASKTFTTDTAGSFSIAVASNAILGARKLVMFALARDSNGIVLWNKNQDPTGSTDNTILQSTLDPIGQVAVKQTVQATLHLTNNSSKITAIITVDLNLQGSGIVDTRTVTIPPGTPQPVTFTFTAPQSPGTYALTVSSTQYGTPFATQTLQVTLLQGNLQLLVPVIIGLVAAIIILAFYLIRRQPEREMEEGEKPKSTGPKAKPRPGPTPPTSKSLTQA